MIHTGLCVIENLHANPAYMARTPLASHVIAPLNLLNRRLASRTIPNVVLRLVFVESLNVPSCDISVIGASHPIVADSSAIDADRCQTIWTVEVAASCNAVYL